MIIFIGLGLNPTNISLKGLEAAKNSDKIYGDLNTGTLLNDELRYFEEKIDRSVEKMPEADIGEKETQLLKEAKEKDIALLIPGDPMIGTSHSKLRITAAQKNIETKIIHGASIESAAGETGLSLHNFGRSAFLSMPNKAYFVIAGDQKTAYETLKENKESGLHTLLLLDIRTDKKEYLSPGKAISYLLMLEKHINEGALSEKTIILSLSRAGTPEVRIIGHRAEKIKEMDFGRPPYSLIIPGELTDRESKGLKEFAEIPENILK